MTIALVDRTESTVEDVLATEIRVTEARLAALRFAYDALVGRPTLTPVPDPEPAEQAPPPASPRHKGRYRNEEKHRIVDRAVELRSTVAAAAEFGVAPELVATWRDAGFGLSKRLPGNQLPEEAANDLRT